MIAAEWGVRSGWGVDTQVWRFANDTTIGPFANGPDEMGQSAATGLARMVDFLYI